MNNEQLISKAVIQYNKPRIIKIITAIYLIIVLLTLVIGLITGGSSYIKESRHSHGDDGEISVLRIGWFEKEEIVFIRRVSGLVHCEWSVDEYYEDEYTIEWGPAIKLLLIYMLLLGLPFIENAIMKYECRITNLIVTDTQVSGSYRHFLHKQNLHMPIEKVDSLSSSVSLRDKLIRSGETLMICTTSGIIRLHFVQNAVEVITKTMERIKEIREKNTTQQIVDLKDREQLESAKSSGQMTSEADEIVKFKELLDKGVITQEEFDVKKKQLLGL